MSVHTEKQEGTVHADKGKVPEIMRAAALDRFGGPDVLSVHQLPVPVLDPGEVLIAIHTAGVGTWDAQMRAGWSPSGGSPKFPLVLGSDGAGTIAAIGSRIRRFKVGEPVYAYSFDNPKGGFYAEYVAVDAHKVAPLPRDLGLREAGGLPTTGLTALQGIDSALDVTKNESVLIHGGSGGVGTLAIQFAKLRGARVLATASGEDGVALALRLGADAAIDSRKEDVQSAAREFAPEGIDGVLGLTGGETLDACLSTLRSGGCLAYPNGVEPAPKKRSGIRVISYDAVAGVREFEHLAMAIEAVKLQVPIAAAFSLGEAAKAHQRIEQGHVLGKIVLQID